MDQKAVAFARVWARRYIREHHPHGLDASDVETMILRSMVIEGTGSDLFALLDANIQHDIFSDFKEGGNVMDRCNMAENIVHYQATSEPKGH